MLGAVALYARGGRSINDVARETGVSWTGLWEALIEAGLRKKRPLCFEPVSKPPAAPMTYLEAQAAIRATRSNVERDLAALGGMRLVGEAQLRRVYISGLAAV